MVAAGRPVEFRVIQPGTPEFAQSEDLRYRVMYEPFELSRDFVGGSGRAPGVHVGGFSGDLLVAYGRLVPDDDGLGGALYQVVVDVSLQGSGVGSRLVETLLRIARSYGLCTLRLDARVPAVGFYERLGFAVTGAEFRNPTGLPHRPMMVSLS